MTVFVCEGFETFGDKTTAGSTVQTRINATDSGGDGSLAYALVTGGHGGDVSIIDDFETSGFALQFPDLDAARAEYVRFEFPDGTGRFSDYKLTTNASHPVMCVGFRYYNADTTPDLATTMFQLLTGTGTAQASVRRDSNQTDITAVAATGGGTSTAVGAMTVDTWHYIEIEFKFSTSGASGYIKVYVDGVEVLDTGAFNVSAFTFNTGYGFDVGAGASSNQTGGNNIAIDDVYAMEIDGVTHTVPLGPCRVVLLNPSADATPNDWTPDSGVTNYTQIDEQDWVTTDYVDATTTLDDDHYDIDDLPATTTVHGIQIDCVCTAVDGTPTLHLGTHDGTNSDEESMGVISTGGTVNKRMFFETDPAGGAWSEADVNAVEATQRMTE